MITLLILYSIFTTLFIIYIYCKPRFELKLTEYDTYNCYTLYVYYIDKSNEKEVKLFSFKTKKKKHND